MFFKKSVLIQSRWLKCLALTVLAFWVSFLALAVDIYWYGCQVSERSADAALVLGAAAWGNRPSPVYKERINEAIRLYKIGRVKKVIFTGGTKDPDFPSEALVAKNFAIQSGIKENVIFVDSASHTTIENLLYARAVMAQAGISTVLLVTDPLHMRRSMRIAEAFGIDASPAATTTSKFRSWPVQIRFLWRETWLNLELLLLGPNTKLEQIKLDFSP